MIDTKKHPISIIKVTPIELSIKANVEPDNREKLGVIPYTMSVGHSDYDSSEKIIGVGVKFKTGKKDEPDTSDLPFSLTVELSALFKVDEEKFPIEHIKDWAIRNAPLIIYPYLREHVYALTIRAGFPPMMLPLLEVPTFKIEKKDSSTQNKVS